jgi:transposase
MPRPVPPQVRRFLWEQSRLGEGAAALAQATGLKPRTVRDLLKRFRERGLDGVLADYGPRASSANRAASPARIAALELRRRHPSWGAARVRRVLSTEQTGLTCPSERTLARWFRRAGLPPAAPGRRPQDPAADPEDPEVLARRQTDVEWMLRVLQGKEPLGEIHAAVGALEKVEALVADVRNGGLKTRNKALAVLAHHRGVPIPTIASFLHLSPRTVASYCETHQIYGYTRLAAGFYPRTRKADDELLCNTVFAVLHSPPSTYDLNRTTWRMPDLARVLADKGLPACPAVIRQIIRSAGYTWRKARTALTSHDPQYREKLALIQSILGSLGPDERFFSIDEFGPFAVKMQGGRSLTPPGRVRIVPQHQRSRGSLIVTAALELATNQVTHFYSASKNTEEMIRLLEVLLQEYRDCSRIYLSWDAASWHASKRFFRRVEAINSEESRKAERMPRVELAPLPAGAQFLNVIESVFSGMARAILHNSDYESVDACKSAIDRHFAERNAFFQAHPRRAGKTIWGKENAPSQFSASNNCKDRGYYYFGL